MGEIDQLDDAVHHGVAERDQRKNRTIGDPVDHDLQEEGEVGGRFRGEDDRQDQEDRRQEHQGAEASTERRPGAPQTYDQFASPPETKGRGEGRPFLTNCALVRVRPSSRLWRRSTSRSCPGSLAALWTRHRRWPWTGSWR